MAQAGHASRWRWWPVWVLSAVLMSGVAWAALHFFFPRAPRVGPLAKLEPVHGQTLVFVPHSDDETLATGGLLQQAETLGNRPQVVWVTGSDAFTLSAEAYYRRFSLSGADMIAYGRQRLSESRKAMGLLGLPPERLTFLGYPDHALHRLWLECWTVSQPCTSPTTHVNSVPYREARSPGSPFAGRAVLQELVAILRQSRPAVVVYPHPNEAHVDHWGLSNFVTAALEEVRRTDPGWRPPAEWLYLVHRGDWPAPKGYLPSALLLPPSKLVGGMTTWHTQALTPDQTQRKEAAVRAYATQTLVLHRYMQSFVRTNELFGTVERTSAPVLGARGDVDVRSGHPPWKDMAWTPVLTDPRGDTLARWIKTGSDLEAVWLARDEKTLSVAAQMAASPGRSVAVHALVRGFRRDTGWGAIAHVVTTGKGQQRVEAWPTALGQARVAPFLARVDHVQDRVAVTTMGEWVRFTFPLDALGPPEAVMINVETQINGILIDRSAWRLVGLDGR